MTAGPHGRPPRRAVVGRLLAAAVVLAFSTGLGEAATFRLRIDDEPDSGFNDPTPVKRTKGNGGSTLGEQRLRAFEAAAREWGNRLVSPVEILVAVQWVPLDCEATMGTLAQSGPTFAFRSIPGEPLADTWYAYAQANSLAGEELSPESPDAAISVAINSDVGSEGCLDTLAWSYRVGAAAGNRKVSLFDIVLHELAHGLGFLSFVSEDGEKLGGFDDAYSRNLEDHSRRKKWPALSDEQRKASSMDPGDLHWVGADVGLHAAMLLVGTDPGGRHVLMYSPKKFEEGGSVSHFDPVLWANLDALMGPFTSDKIDILLTDHVLRDIGWSVNTLAVTGVGQVDGVGWPDLAVLRSSEEPAGHAVRVVDPADGRAIGGIPIPPEYSAIDLGSMADFADTGAREVATLVWQSLGREIKVLVHDALSGLEIVRLSFPAGQPKALLVLPDYAGSSAEEIAVFGVTRSGALRVWIHDGGTGTVIARLKLPKGLAGDFAWVPSFDGSAAPEIAVVFRQPGSGVSSLQLRDGSSGKRLRDHRLPSTFYPLFASGVRDFASSPAAEVAVLGLDRLTGQAVLYVVDASSGAILTIKTFSDIFQPRGLETVDDFADGPADEVTVLGRRFADLKTTWQVIDAGTGRTLVARTQGRKHSPRALAVLRDGGGSAADDVALVATNARDGKLRVFVRDAGGKPLKKWVVD